MAESLCGAGNPAGATQGPSSSISGVEPTTSGVAFDGDKLLATSS
jgi:hypothetical protein